MTFKELIIRNIDAIDLIMDTMLDLYPDQEHNIDGYHNVFAQLHLIKPVRNEDNLVINITLAKDDFFDDGEVEDYYHVGAYVKHDPEQTYAIELTPWAEWLGYEVDEEALQLHGEFGFIAHCLWEMTFCGFTEQEIGLQRQELKQIVEDIDSGKAKTISWDELKKELDMLEED